LEVKIQCRLDMDLSGLRFKRTPTLRGAVKYDISVYSPEIG